MCISLLLLVFLPKGRRDIQQALGSVTLRDDETNIWNKMNMVLLIIITSAELSNKIF